MVNFLHLLAIVNSKQVQHVNEQAMTAEQAIASDQPAQSASKVRHALWAVGGFLCLALGMVGVVLPIVAMLNFIVFIWPEIQRLNSNRRYRNSRQATQFRQAVHQQQRQENVGYHHKWAVCGRTDTDYPDLQFRYCSKCVGYHCFCQDHIFSHVHFTE